MMCISRDLDQLGNLPASPQPCCIVLESQVPHKDQKLKLDQFFLW